MDHRESIVALRQFLSTQILGGERLIERLLIALLADGHMLVEGAPGLAKTRAIKELAEGLEAEFHRIQFTPTCSPPTSPAPRSIVRKPAASFSSKGRSSTTRCWPTRSTVRRPRCNRHCSRPWQSAVSVGRSTYDLPPLFPVMATQNPIEQEGTYLLPEAQLDRFLLHVKIGFPDASVERRILQQARGEAINGEAAPEHRVSQQAIFAARKDILGLYMADAVEEYRAVGDGDPHAGQVRCRAGRVDRLRRQPRGSIALDRCARAHARLAGRDFVSPEDIQAMLFDVLRHRLILSFEAEAAGIDQDRVIQRILDVVAVA